LLLVLCWSYDLAVGSEVQDAEDQPFALKTMTIWTGPKSSANKHQPKSRELHAKSAKAVLLQQLERVPGVASCVIG